MKKRKIAALILCLMMLCAAASSCGAKYSDEEVRLALETLLPKSFELNKIYFGEGLPLSNDRALIEEFYGNFDSDSEDLIYHPVASDCGYTTEEQIKDATLEVFTEEYAGFLMRRAFSGITATYNEGTADERNTAVMYPRYIEQNGILTVRIDTADEALKIGRDYDLSAMNIAKKRRDYALIDIPTVAEDGTQCNVRLKLVLTEEGWRLDSPTY